MADDVGDNDGDDDNDDGCDDKAALDRASCSAAGDEDDKGMPDNETSTAEAAARSTRARRTASETEPMSYLPQRAKSESADHGSRSMEKGR